VPARVAAYGFVATTVVLLVLFSILYLTAQGEGNDEGFVELGLFIWLSLVLVAALVAYFVLSIFGIAGLKNMAKEDIEKLESKKPAFIVKANVKAKQFNGRVHGVFHEERQLSKSPWVKAVVVTVTILLLVVIIWALSTQLDNGYAPGMY
jgi:predicted membrane protein